MGKHRERIMKEFRDDRNIRQNLKAGTGNKGSRNQNTMADDTNNCVRKGSKWVTSYFQMTIDKAEKRLGI